MDALADLVAALVDGRPAPPAPLELVRRHRLAPLAHRLGRDELRADYVTASLRAEQHRAIAVEATDALTRAGVPVVLHKGISYAYWLYDDPGERPMTDVDLLVPPDEHDRAIEVLAGLGYRHAAGKRHQRSRRHHAVELKRPHASIDLHRSPIQLGRTAIDLAAVWRRTQAAPWIPGAMRLEPVDETLFHVANLVRHGFTVPLLAYVDAGRLLRRLDAARWSAMLERADAWRFRRVLDAALEVIEHVAGWRAKPHRWWLPGWDELVRGTPAPRPVHLARKLLLVEGPRELAGLLATAIDGRIRK